MNLYIDIGTRYIQNMKTCSVYHWNQNRNKADNKCSSLQQRYLFVYLTIKLLVCVKDSTCLWMATPVYCFSIFGSIFGVLFCLLIKELILGCDTIWQSMRSSYEQFEVWVHFLKWTNKKHFFLENCTLIRPEFFIPFH